MDNGAMPDAGVVISSICCRICLKMNHSEIQRKNDHYVYILQCWIILGHSAQYVQIFAFFLISFYNVSIFQYIFL